MEPGRVGDMYCLRSESIASAVTLLYQDNRKCRLVNGIYEGWINASGRLTLLPHGYCYGIYRLQYEHQSEAKAELIAFDAARGID